MDRDSVTWAGYWPAAPTPFTAEGGLDIDAWRAVLRLYLDAGVHGILVNGSSGEWFAQSPSERRRVAELAVEEVGGRVPVVIGCSAFTPGESGELARHAASIGADGVLATPPPYVVPGPDEIVEFYRRLGDAAPLPLMVYNWPRGTNVDIDAPLAERLARLDTVVALKDSTGDRLGAMRTLEAVAGRVRYFGTFISRLGLALLREIGGDGNIDGGGLGARFGVAFYEAVRAGDLEAARVHADRYASLSERLVRPDFSGRFASPVSQLKAAMNLLGQPGGWPRPPLLPLRDEAALARLHAVLRDAGL